MLPKYIAQLMLHKVVRCTNKRLGTKLYILLLNYYIAQGDSNEALVEVILATKETRGSKYYQVGTIVCA